MLLVHLRLLGLLAGLPLFTSGSNILAPRSDETVGLSNTCSCARALEVQASGAEVKTAEEAAGDDKDSEDEAVAYETIEAQEEVDAKVKAAVACTTKWLPEHTKWPRGIVNYGFGASANAPLRKVVRVFMDKIEAKTKKCIQFKALSKQNPEKNFLWIFYQKVDVIGSLGMKTGNQSLALGEWHSHPLANHISRQLLRAAGLNYEQNRPDRDNYVTIQSKNKDNRLFGKDCKFNTYGVPYDFGSIMHFHEKETGSHLEEKKVVIKAKSGKGPVPKVRTQELSEKDVEKIYKMYNC